MKQEHGEIHIYQAENGQIALEVQLAEETVWLNQAQMAELFQRDQSVLSRHIRNVFNEGELDETSNMQKMHIAGSAKPVALYSLDVIISVGYRVKSQRGTQFRIWATKVLKQHLVKTKAKGKIKNAEWQRPEGADKEICFAYPEDVFGTAQVHRSAGSG